MNPSVEKTAILSDQGFLDWAESVQDAVSAALARRPSAAEVADGGRDPNEPGFDDESEADRADTDDNSDRDAAYIAELLVDPKIDPTEMFRVCRELTADLGAKIIGIDYDKQGTTIKCTAPDPAILIGALETRPGISSCKLVTDDYSSPYIPSMNESYLVELLVSPDAGPSDTFQVCQNLRTNLESEIISIDYSRVGTTVKCTVPDPSLLLTSLRTLSGVSSWTLSPE